MIRVAQQRSGFTLIELSIVLVIIGLLAGGILVGRDLITASEVRATVSQIEKFKTAVYAFQNKFNCIPGDCYDTAKFGFSGIHGNGNGIVDVCYGCNSGLDSSEPDFVWQHLKDANLIAENLIDYASIMAPQSKAGDAVFLVWYTQSAAPPLKNVDGHAYWGIVKSKFSSCGASPLNCPVLSPEAARRIDEKLDDGMPYTGSITGNGGLHLYALPPTVSEGPAGSGDKCVSTSVTPNEYNLTNRNPSCSILIRYM